MQLQSGPNKAMALGLTSSAPYNAKQEGGFGKSGSRRTEYIVGGIVSLLALLLILELAERGRRAASQRFLTRSARLTSEAWPGTRLRALPAPAARFPALSLRSIASRL